MARALVWFILAGALFSSAALADLVRPEIGANLKDALDLIHTYDVKNCPAARKKIQDISLVSDQTPAETKIVRDLGRIIVSTCDYAEQHNGQFPSEVP